MATPGSNIPTSAAHGQPQMKRDDIMNQPSNTQSQGQDPNFLQDTGTQVKNMAQGAADIGKGAAQGAVSIAKGAAHGATNLVQGAADAMKNTFGVNNPPPSDHNTTNTTAFNNPSPTSTHPSNI